MGRTGGPDAARDLRARRRSAERRRRARARAACQPARRLPALEGAQGRGPGLGPAGRHPPHLPGGPGGAGRLESPARPVLEPSARRVQGRRRARQRGGLMTTQTDATTIRNDIVVDAPLERAFRVFVEQFDRIKPREHNLLAVPIAETVFEPRAGGHIYDRGEDGSECRWARVLAFDPPHRFVITWDISIEWQVETDLDRTSEIEVRFTPDGPDRTRVKLEHRKLERH